MRTAAISATTTRTILWHEVIGARYLQRNPHLLVRRVMHDVPDHGAAAQVFPDHEAAELRVADRGGGVHLGVRPTIYLGGAFGGEFEGSMFEAEPVHNLVHRDVLAQAGPTFTARRGNRIASSLPRATPGSVR